MNKMMERNKMASDVRITEIQEDLSAKISKIASQNFEILEHLKGKK
jgi:hypothetical protein